MKKKKEETKCNKRWRIGDSLNKWMCEKKLRKRTLCGDA